MDAKQRYITDYEIFAEDAFVYEIRQMGRDISLAVAEEILERAEFIPRTDGEVLSFYMIANAKKEDRYFLIDFINEDSEPLILLYIEEITLDEYLDLMLDYE